MSLFGEHEDVANARIEFEDGTVANLTASRASYRPCGRCGSGAPRAMPRSISPPSRPPWSSRPTEFLRGELDLEGVDLGQPSAVKEHLFGKVLRVDQVQTAGREPLALELEDFVQAVRGESRPRVSGDDALRAMRLADQVLQQPQRPPLGRRDRGGPAARPARRDRLGPPRPPRLADQEPAAERKLAGH